ncbi:MAG: hypothetical protein NTW67_06715 [Candidatus Woesearchaeota archaeon]|nr:hypothetical protein [Candidatus Woesearchaeota archaeon]
MELEEVIVDLERINDFLRSRREIRLSDADYHLCDTLLRRGIDVRRILHELKIVKACYEV